MIDGMFLSIFFPIAPCTFPPCSLLEEKNSFIL